MGFDGLNSHGFFLFEVEKKHQGIEASWFPLELESFSFKQTTSYYITFQIISRWSLGKKTTTKKKQPFIQHTKNPSKVPRFFGVQKTATLHLEMVAIVIAQFLAFFGTIDENNKNSSFP